jgi:Lon-like protease
MAPNGIVDSVAQGGLVARSYGALALPLPMVEAGPRQPSRRRWRLGLGLLVALLALVGAGVGVARQPSPYSVIMPANVIELADRVRLPEEQRRESGWLAATAVLVRKASYGDWLRARFDPAAGIVTTGELRPNGMTDQEYGWLGQQRMLSSKNAATAVALRAAGLVVDVLGQGELVTNIFSGSTADGTLRRGDVIIASGPNRIHSFASLSAALRPFQVGAKRPLTVLRNREMVEVELSLGYWPLDSATVSAGFQVATEPYVYDVRPPFPVEIDMGRVIGPSAGLMFSLALLDALTPGDLTGGHRVAGTGTIDVSGRVGGIGSAAQKVLSAEAEHAELFLVPSKDAAQAAAAARSLRVVPVDTFEAALGALQELGGGLASLR